MGVECAFINYALQSHLYVMFSIVSCLEFDKTEGKAILFSQLTLTLLGHSLSKAQPL